MTADPGASDADPRIATVEASPALVARHDKASWLALFSDDGEVEDPVGSLPCRVGDGGRDRGRVAAFWDTYIAPNGIRFEVHRDLVDGDDVLRDVTIHTTLSTGARLAVPSYVLYRLVPDHDAAGADADAQAASPARAFRIRRLAAHWEIVPMVGQVLRQGLRGWWTVTVMTFLILRHQGLRGLASYLKSILGGLRRSAGRRIAERSAASARTDKVITSGPCVAFRVLCADGAVSEVRLIDHHTNGIRTFRPAG
ncbi:MAG: nuclear transport factor 2 family protein [Deltaproteobacteria bacterium]|nr:nuclear transport factor 2 family protein [Deltaproteobacteria bacterium]